MRRNLIFTIRFDLMPIFADWLSAIASMRAAD